MAGIFAGSSAAEGRSVALLLNEHDYVLASSDAHWIAPGTKVPSSPEAHHICSHTPGALIWCKPFLPSPTKAIRGLQGGKGRS